MWYLSGTACTKCTFWQLHLEAVGVLPRIACVKKHIFIHTEISLQAFCAPHDSSKMYLEGQVLTFSTLVPILTLILTETETQVKKRETQIGFFALFCNLY